MRDSSLMQQTHYQPIKSIKQRLGFTLRSSWLSGAGLVVRFKSAVARMEWGRLACVLVYVRLFLNSVNHRFSTQLQWDKKPELTSGRTAMYQVELNGCWQRPLVDNWWFLLLCLSFSAEFSIRYQNVIPMISLTSSAGFPQVLWHSLIYRGVGEKGPL